jgi:hypothetical protein
MDILIEGENFFLKGRIFLRYKSAVYINSYKIYYCMKQNCLKFCIVLLLISLVYAIADDRSNWEYYSHDNSTGAMCLDGSAPGFYFWKATS